MMVTGDLILICSSEYISISHKYIALKRFKSSRKVSPASELLLQLKKAFRPKNSVCPSDGDGGAISA